MAKALARARKAQVQNEALQQQLLDANFHLNCTMVGKSCKGHADGPCALHRSQKAFEEMQELDARADKAEILAAGYKAALERMCEALVPTVNDAESGVTEHHRAVEALRIGREALAKAPAVAREVDLKQLEAWALETDGVVLQPTNLRGEFAWLSAARGGGYHGYGQGPTIAQAIEDLHNQRLARELQDLVEPSKQTYASRSNWLTYSGRRR